jgi:hypothetical protein
MKCWNCSMELDTPSYSDAFAAGKIKGASEYRDSLKNVLERLEKLYNNADSPISANVVESIIFILDEFDRKNDENV